MRNLSIHSFCWIPGWSAEAADHVAPRAAQAGYDHVVVPLRDHAAIDAAAIAHSFTAHGITAVCSANQLPDADISSADPAIRTAGLARHRNSLRLARDMGAVHVGGATYGLFGKADAAATADMRIRSAEAMAVLSEEAAGMGLRLAIELLNRYETNMLTTVNEGLAYLDLVGRPANLWLHLDTFHMNIEEVDPLAALDCALPHLAYFELDQNDRGLLDRGHIDFAPYLSRLKAAGYDKLIGVEGFSSAVSGPDVARGVAAWRPLFANGDEIADSGRRVLTRR
ncbi:sugar phosphate isomerase/epimerase family protein [Falsirhodobacter sp. 20TX0035]|uniref:sugar phosphate isomerase/epimerase family protein n=1 Tax=Falsirhodobacter sp. 20TX0035 TaxID=3022019 RepID=UPI00232C4FF3|nr:sugar phosphate isomerase/epimerase family protein [Falsirhodobacter sp. 20TX0035]MDB6454386.1 sugar phosphate isomerase/epimerase [Falsirhodobacter sp. 20TX0035]